MGMTYVWTGLFISIAYVLGSIPTGYWAGRLLQDIDIREQGSGSTGATNVLRTLGKRAAIVVLGIDILKGALAVGLVSIFASIFAQYGFYGVSEPIPWAWQPWLGLFTGLAAVLGHSKSIFLNFTGGKSVATGLGVLFVMSPAIALATLGSFALMLALSRIVSLSSITGAIAVIGLTIGLKQPLAYCIFASVAGLYVIFRHKKNIERIFAGTEPKIGQKLVEEASN
jgi:glycerol-3-phosphate acyltransferase PlsY